MIRLEVFLHGSGEQEILSKLGQILTVVKHQEKDMASLADFVIKQTEFNNSLGTSLADIQADIQTLNDKIGELASAQGSLSVEQQAALDELVLEGSALADKAGDLNQMTPPAIPTA